MAESQIGANFVVAFNPSVVNAIQDRTLVRVFKDALFPRLLYRGEAAPELWAAQLGTNTTFTRAGLIRPSTRPLQANQDPTPKGWEAEQWEANAKQWGDAIDTHMPTSSVSLASTYLRNMHQLGLHAGQSLNRAVRDRVMNAYTAGNTVVNGNQAGSTALVVNSINGFTHRLLNGRPSPVSAANPLPITITTGGVTTAYNVTAATPAVAGDLIHGGTLTLDVAHAGVVDRDIVLAANRSQVINSGGSVSIDGITAGDQFTMADIRAAVAQMRKNNVPAHEDGTYHCHLDPDSESQIFGDNEFQRLQQGLPDFIHYREMVIGKVLGCAFYRNTEAPLNATVDQDPQYGHTFAPEVYNTPTSGDPVEIHRPIFTGAGYLEEKYLDESRYISEAGVIGKIGEFAVLNNGIQVMTERIRLILRAPLDRLQQMTSAAWSFSGDWTLPTDSVSTSSPADFKRAVVVQHGA
jgi:hypothetical protein